MYEIIIYTHIAITRKICLKVNIIGINGTGSMVMNYYKIFQYHVVFFIIICSAVINCHDIFRFMIIFHKIFSIIIFFDINYNFPNVILHSAPKNKL